jgi:hypothetical protein
VDLDGMHKLNEYRTEGKNVSFKSSNKKKNIKMLLPHVQGKDI